MTTTIPHQAIYRRWRAQTFAEIVGQEPVVETLRNAVRSDRVGHALLFVGPRGTGKTSLARIVAKAVNCLDLRDGDACDVCSSCVSIREGTSLDITEIDAASNNGIDEVRRLRERLPYPPAVLRRKVYILDEAHQITGPAWNALLKSIEEPPDFVTFMFASTEPSRFPPAILSRLQRFDVRRLTAPEIEGKLARILAADGREADDDAVRLIARLAAGGMRDAESMLDQLLSAAPERITEDQVRGLLGLADADTVDAFVSALVQGDVAAGVALLDTLDERGRDLRALLDQVVDAIRRELVAGLSQPARPRYDAAALTAAARRIAAIDPASAGIGGLRFQLELALFRSAFSGERATGVSVEPVMQHPVQVERASGHPATATGDDATRSAAARPAPSPSRSASPDGPVPPSTRAASPAGPSDPTAMATSATAATANESSDLDRLVDGWVQVIASVSPAVRAVITECRPLAVDGNIVTLGFPEAKEFLKGVAERKAKDLDTAVGAFLGRAVNVRCVATNIEIAAAAPADSAYVLAEARRIFADDIVEVGEVS